MAPSAKSLILDLLSTLRRGTMPVAALVQAGGLFGLADNNVRVALARLLAAGNVERDERGRYRLGPAAEPVNRQVGSWRRIGERVRPWAPGTWLAVHTAGLAEAGRDRNRREQALRFLGFAELTPGLSLRPANLRGGVAGATRELHALGLDPAAIVCAVSGLGPDAEARARGLWDAAGLAEGYRRSLAALSESEHHLAGKSDGEAMVESFLLGGRVMRQLVFDPLLPDPIVPVAERDALVAALRGYDRLGRACWASFLAQHGVPSLRAPADTRIADGATRMALQ
jgi:phenylacetic acid degradation operon negative regulatory protein